MADVAFLGLGQMGLRMSRRLLESGRSVVVWNRTAGRAEPLRDAGAEVAASPAEAARSADLVITMVRDGEALESVVFGPDGAASGLRDGSVLVEMSTIGPDAVRELRERLPGTVDLVDAPVLGSTPHAERGELAVFVGASDELFERVRPVLEVFGTTRRVGGPGAGAAIKLVLNSTIGAVAMGLGEALALADSLGLERDVVYDALEGSAVGATMKRKRENLERGEFPGQFKLSLAAKDLRLVVETAERAGVRLELANLATRRFEEADAAGRGDEDYSAVIDELRSR